MKIINFFELDENNQVLNEKKVESSSHKQVEVPSDDYFKKAENNFEISGQWLVIDELLNINNKYLNYIKNKEENLTWLKLPAKYVEENYMINYKTEDECPLGVDVLIKEDGYPIGVITGCDSIKQAKVDNNLDGHKYKGDLGIKLNNDYFLTYNQEDEEFRLIKTHTDWDRGKHTI
jgi:hypothetical protein